jgi:N-acylglucosamine 2-epimerase
MFSKLYNEVSEYHRPDVLDAAVHGGEFLMRYIKVKNQMRCYFAVSEVGLPVKLQRKPYTECFYIIGLYELYRATCDETYKVWRCDDIA